MPKDRPARIKPSDILAEIERETAKSDRKAKRVEILTEVLAMVQKGYRVELNGRRVPPFK